LQGERPAHHVVESGQFAQSSCRHFEAAVTTCIARSLNEKFLYIQKDMDFQRLREAQTNGFNAKAPHYNSIFNYLENPELTPILRSLITQSSLPLKSVETEFCHQPSQLLDCRPSGE
jgi:hypothetical protein